MTTGSLLSLGIDVSRWYSGVGVEGQNPETYTVSPLRVTADVGAFHRSK
jgi:hypothetical protein